MNTCDICGKEEFLPYRCSYCGGTYCATHRLPETHYCTGEWNVPVNVKKREEPMENTDKRFKAKMPKIPFSSSSSSRSGRHDFDFGDFPPPSQGLGAYGYNNIIIGTCTVFFLISMISGYSAIEYLALNPDSVLFRPWQLVTSMFLHAGFMHFLINMVVLFFFGSELERRVGGKWYLVIFFLAGLAGNFAYLGYAYLTNPLIPALGASGAIYGVLGTLAIIAPEIRVLLFFAIPMSIRSLIVLFAIVDIAGFMGSIGPSGIQTGVAHSAHLAGLLVGLYYGKRLRIVRRWRNF
ncbi:MAG: rhomboid family intramembrane serine protease [Archaeoglobaceae archaeon]